MFIAPSSFLVMRHFLIDRFLIFPWKVYGRDQIQNQVISTCTNALLLMLSIVGLLLMTMKTPRGGFLVVGFSVDDEEDDDELLSSSQLRNFDATSLSYFFVAVGTQVFRCFQKTEVERRCVGEFNCFVYYEQTFEPNKQQLMLSEIESLYIKTEYFQIKRRNCFVCRHHGCLSTLMMMMSLPVCRSFWLPESSCLRASY